MDFEDYSVANLEKKFVLHYNSILSFCNLQNIYHNNVQSHKSTKNFNHQNILNMI